MENNRPTTNNNSSSYLSLIGGIIAFLSFFSPWAGCNRYTVSGAELASHNELLYMILISAIVIIGAFVYFNHKRRLHKSRSFIGVSSIAGILFMLLEYMGAKEQGSLEVLDIKWGAYTSVIGFILSFIGISFLHDDKKERKSESEITTLNKTKLPNEEQLEPINPKTQAKISVFENKIKEDPLNIRLLNEYAKFLCNIKDYNHAEIILYRAYETDNNSSETKKLLLLFLKKRGNYDEAINIGNELLEIEPDDPDVLSEIADIWLKKDDKNNALKYTELALKNIPNHLKALEIKALVVQKTNPVEAFELWKQIYNMDNHNVNALIYVGYNYLINNDFDKITKMFPAIFESNNEDTYEFYIGLIYHTWTLTKTDGQQSEIEENFHHTFDIKKPEWENETLNKTIAEIAYYIAESYWNNEQFEKVESYLNKIEELGQKKLSKKGFATLYLYKSEHFIKKNDPQYAGYIISLAFNLLEDKNAEIYKQCINQKQKIEKLIKTKKKKKRKNTYLIVSLIIIVIISFFFIRHYVVESHWKNVTKENTIAAYQKYIEKYPGGKYYMEACNRQEALIWETVKKKNIANGYVQYIKVYPYGKYVDSAREVLKTLTPKIETIKKDLIGNKISDFWSFDNVKEFKKFTVLDTTISNNQLIYKIKMELLGENQKKPIDCEISVTYNFNENRGWKFEKFHLFYIKYTYTLYPTKWVKIKVQHYGYKWNCHHDFNLIFKVPYNGWYENYKYFKRGPKYGYKSISTYNKNFLYMKSLDDKKDVKFTFTPSN